MITDKLVGPRVRIVLGKFLPYIFMDAMRDSPEAAVTMFESMTKFKNRENYIFNIFYQIHKKILS